MTGGGRTARLVIEPLTLAHAPGLLAALDDPRVGEHIGGPDVTTLAALEERIAWLEGGAPAGSGMVFRNWVMRLDGVVVGRLEATIHDGLVEVAYLLGPRWWGHGYATEGTAWMLEELAGEGAVDAWGCVAAANLRSAALLERLGFREADPTGVPLLSWDPGDRSFRRVAGIGEGAAGVVRDVTTGGASAADG